MLRFFEIRRRVGDLALADVGFAKIVIRVEIVGLELDSFAKVLLSLGVFAETRKVGGEIGLRFRGLGIQANSLFEMPGRFGVLRLSGVVEPEQLVELEAFGRCGKQLFDERSRLGVASGFVGGYGLLELAIEITSGGRRR